MFQWGKKSGKIICKDMLSVSIQYKLCLKCIWHNWFHIFYKDNQPIDSIQSGMHQDTKNLDDNILYCKENSNAWQILNKLGTLKNNPNMTGLSFRDTCLSSTSLHTHFNQAYRMAKL